MKRLHGVIDGKPFPSEASDTIPILYPATNQVQAEMDVALEREVDAAVDAAARAFPIWRRMTGTERGRILHRIADRLRRENDDLAMMEVMDTGKPISEANQVDVQSGADALEFFAGVAASMTGDYHTLGDNYAYTRCEPLGVVAGIGAWNYPLQITCWKAAPALAAGNTMVMKPSELTPQTTIRFAEICHQEGLPEGVFNVVTGDHRTGQHLCQHPHVRKVSLTGSVATGKRVMRDAAETLKHVTLELGGKSPLIIFPDANLGNAVKATMLANFYTQGEICSNGTRVFVHQDVIQPFTEMLRSATESLVIGDPRDPKTEVGSLISESHAESVMQYIQAGRDQGADLVCGGQRHGEVGNFVTPTIFSGCDDSMSIVQEEIFGPVLSLLTFRDEDEVLTRANATPYGLAAGVFTNDLNRAHRVTAELEAGTCWINTYNITPVEIPFGGYKQSGMGRENSRHALSHYTQLKTVYVETGDL